jgi:hypothetical protein
MSTTRPSRFNLLACVLAPAGAVLIAREILPGAGPKGAAAQTVSTAASPRNGQGDQPPKPRERSDNSQILAAVNELRDVPGGANPFVSQVPRALTKIVMTTPEVMKRKLPEFSLTSIADGARQTIAMIDGKVRRVGDDLGEGWTVSGIEHSSGQVTIASPDGVLHTLMLRK